MDWAFTWGFPISTLIILVVCFFAAESNYRAQTEHQATLKTPEDHEREALRFLKRAQVDPYHDEYYMKKYFLHKALAKELRDEQAKSG